MHRHDLSAFTHHHHYAHGHERESERRTALAVALTGAMMVAEIAAGYLFHSMALLADGWHMATHTLALGIGVASYRYARLHAGNPSYSFGTGKIHALGGYTSALFLAAVALFVAIESVETFLAPKPVQYTEALGVALLGLLVNLASIRLLRHDHHHDHDHHQHEHDISRRAAYAHVVTDALTSVFAIVALLAGKYFGWRWVDPLVGLVGAIIIARWSWGLLRTTTALLLDRDPSPELAATIRERIESDGDSTIADFHVWQLAPGKRAAILSIVADAPRTVEEYKSRLQDLGLAHLTVELNRCPGA